MIDLDPSVNKDEDVTIAVDSSGIKVSNRGLNEKWKVRKGYLKIHIAVDVKTGNILSLEVTKENVHDGKVMKDLVDDAGDKAKVTRVLADGAYDSRKNFSYLAERGIDPAIKVRKNSSMKARGCMPRKLAVVEQLDDYEGWKKKHEYGMRWMVESAFSAFKRTFGEHVLAKSMQNMVKELMIKAYLYNLFMSMNP